MKDRHYQCFLQYQLIGRCKDISQLINNNNKHHILTKPLHWSQQVLEEKKEGIIVSIKVVPNFELERLILGFGSSIEVLSPPSLRKKIGKIVEKAYEFYKNS